MTGFEFLRSLHIFCALASIGGFTLRGYWMLSDDSRLQHRLSKIAPHVIDTVLLGSAIGMLFIWQVSPGDLPWVMAKIFALVIYIALGMVALRFGKTRRIRAIAWFAALLTAGYILSVAYTKSPWGLLSLF